MSVKYVSIVNFARFNDFVIKFVIGETVTNFVWPLDFVFTEVYQDGSFHIGFRYTNNDREAPYRIIFKEGMVQLFHEKGKHVDKYFEERMKFRGKFQWKLNTFWALNKESTNSYGDIIDSVVMEYSDSRAGLWIEETSDEELRGLYLA
jgi:hypothetical protein